MVSDRPTFQTKRLEQSTTRADYDLYRAALEWNLIEPIVIENDADFRSRQDWSNLVEPYHHQVENLITFCKRLPVTLISDDVGLGKTISAGLVASELMARGRVTKILIVCPKLLIPQWGEELRTKFNIQSVSAIGQKLTHAQPPNDVGAVITTYDSAKRYLDTLGQAGFQLLILDEAHKLRNLYGVEKTPQVASRFHSALKERLFKYVLMLTATPIQNRLWDIYSLVDLLTVARGHENPFGAPGMFARNYIADARNEARKLKEDKKDEFRSIVIGYMSRTRRADVPLLFPVRQVLLHKVQPTPEELEIFEIIREPIQELNRLAQISILQALVSSPEALAVQLQNSARNKTVPAELASQVKDVVSRMTTSAKLDGLGALVDQLKIKQGEHWRAVIFTERRETQTTIEAFLGARGITCGVINGDSGSRNQSTIESFKQSPPGMHVIVSTRAGSEGVNLQAANVLVNYDLPWNPMIVEQRIGRVQRLASEHANVSIYNLILAGTFEEYIVGRLMEKLQMASQAVGDVEALLEAAGMQNEEDSKGFEEKLRELVLASLMGQDVQEATRLAEESVVQAKQVLEREEQKINLLIGGNEDAIDVGPRCPKLPPAPKSIPAEDFARQALAHLGGHITDRTAQLYDVALDGRTETIRFQNEVPTEETSTLCRPGTPFFDRLVTRIASRARHAVDDVDHDVVATAEKLSREWTQEFDGAYMAMKIADVRRCFSGLAMLNVRITNAHDSYERLLEIDCSGQGEFKPNQSLIDPIGRFLDDPISLGLSVDYLTNKALEDTGVSEFCRFYAERLDSEVHSAGHDSDKQKKLHDDFTPRIEMSLVGLEGKLQRDVRVQVDYALETHADYASTITLSPYTTNIIDKPDIQTCESTGVRAPANVMGKCAISGRKVFSHLLHTSEISERRALSEHLRTCALTGKHVLSDEVDQSDMTGDLVLVSVLQTSAVSGKKAEPHYIDTCDFTHVPCLKTELRISQISGKKYRMDNEAHSVVSDVSGHPNEFIYCSQTGRALLESEAERCEVTDAVVVPGILKRCDVSGKRVILDQLERSDVSDTQALKTYFVTSSMSNQRLLKAEAIRSSDGKYCTPSEAQFAVWSGENYHPDDLLTCDVTGNPFHRRFAKIDNQFSPLRVLLEGRKHINDECERWETIAETAIGMIGRGRGRVESAERSPDGRHLACSVQIRTWVGFKVRYLGLIYSLADECIIGRVAVGRREVGEWSREK